MLVLGIDSSCDDMCAALVRDGREILSNVVSSQDEIHRKYGGVVPELASRRHLETVLPVVEEAIGSAGVGLKDIEGIGVTYGPGLVVSLLVGLSFAKALSIAKGIPLVGINHLEGHIAIAYLKGFSPPFIALLASGGHTLLCRVDGIGRYTLLGQTRDDAAGEAFDKVAKLLNLGYPGGPRIDLMAKKGDPHSIPFPRPYISRDSFDFSFSGLKTAVLRHVEGLKEEEKGARIPDIVASFQEAVVEVLVEKTIRACRTSSVGRIFVTGGVAANNRLRERFFERGKEEGLEVMVPEPHFCTDNGVMIAVAAYHRLKEGERAPLDLTAVPNLSL